MTYDPPPHVVQHWTVTKPAANGKRGMVVSQSRDAAQAGVAVLEAGGNAIDAAVATAFALSTAEPWNSGLGGIGFGLVHRAGEPNAKVVDFGPVAPRHLSPANFKLTGVMTTDNFRWEGVEGDTNIHGPLSVAVPSSVVGYERLHSTWGRLPLSEVMAPAVALARRGLPVDWFSSSKILGSASILARYAESARIYLRDGLPPIPLASGAASYLKQGRLADTLDRLSQAGLRDYYEGDIAASIVADIKAAGGVIDAGDLKSAAARVVAATEIPWRRGRTLQLASRLTAAPTLARVLETMLNAPYGARPDAAWFALLARTLKSAYVERLSGLGAEEPAKEPAGAETCTTHLTTCDAEGNMVALTTTLMSSFGSRVALPGTGIMLNNGIMWFDPRPNQANSIAPGKRPLTNMCPVIMKQDGHPVLAIGASGGRRILASVFQLMSFIADFGMSPADAAHHPRLDVSSPDEITADSRLAPDILAALAAEGGLEVVEQTAVPVNFACPNVIVRNADGTCTGISDAFSPWSAAVAQN